MPEGARVSSLSVSDSLQAIVPPFNDPAPPLLGLEVEMFGFDSQTFAPLGTAGSRLTPQQLLQRVAEVVPGSHLKVDEPTGVIVGLELSCGNFSLEPGGQMEYATCPKESLSALRADFLAGLRLLEEGGRGEVVFLDHGTNPVAGADLPLVVPKRRYKIMTRYFGSVPNGRGVHMMRYSATAQPNVDVVGKESWLDAVNLTFVLTPFVGALFANSRYFLGQLARPGSERQRIWRSVDPSRSGIPAGVPFEADLPEAYARWARQASVFMVGSLPDGEQPLYGELTFERWEQQGYKGTSPTPADWVTHLGTLFPDLRLRRFLEIRMVDAQSFEHALAPMAFWTAALQTDAARERLWAWLKTVASGLGLVRPADLLGLPADHEAFDRLSPQLLDCVTESCPDEMSRKVLADYRVWLEKREGLVYPQSGLDFVRARATAHPSRVFG